MERDEFPPINNNRKPFDKLNMYAKYISIDLVVV